MKKILITLIILTILSAGAYYFFIYRNKEYISNLSVSGFLAKLNFLENSRIVKKSEEIGKTAQDLKAKAGNIFGGLSEVFGDTVGKVSSTVSSIGSEVDNSKLIKVISILNTGKPTETTLSVSSSVKEVDICANMTLNQSVTYLIEDPFYSLNTTSTYDIDWGDGGIDKRIFTTSTALVSHVYNSVGDFITKFKVVNEKASAEVLRRVCVK